MIDAVHNVWHQSLHSSCRRTAKLTAPADVSMFWHPQGDYLAVKVDRFTKTRKTTYTSFELFSVKGRDIPMEVRHAQRSTLYSLDGFKFCQHCYK